MGFLSCWRDIQNDAQISEKPEDTKQAHVAPIQQTLTNK